MDISDEEEALSHAKTNMNGMLIDVVKLKLLADEAIEIVDSSDTDKGPELARALHDPLTNDEKIYFQGLLRNSTFLHLGTGRERQYWTGFKEYLDHEEN